METRNKGLLPGAGHARLEECEQAEPLRERQLGRRRIEREVERAGEGLELKVAEDAAKARLQVSPPPTEPIAHECPVEISVRRRDERMRAPVDRQEGGVHTRHRGEICAWELLGDREGEPRLRQDRILRLARRAGEPLCRFALQDEIGGAGRGAGREQLRHDRCRDREGQVGNDGVLPQGERVVEEIRMDDMEIRPCTKLRPQVRAERRVYLDGNDLPHPPHQCAREDASPRTDLVDEVIRG